MGRPSIRRLEGRTERRITKAVPVCLMFGEDWFIAEQATTEDVSPHGARLTIRRRCKPGELAFVATPSTHSQVEARVVYCETLRNGNFSVGLEFRPEGVDWGKEWDR